MKLLSRHPAWAALLPAAAAMLALLRWMAQGSGNVYTDLAKKRYLPDPDLGWRLSDGGPVWLGLDAIALLLAFVAGVLVAGTLVRNIERRRNTHFSLLRGLGWGAASLTLAVPIAAFATGLGPQDARDSLPATADVVTPSRGVSGAIDADAGTYRVVASKGTHLVARLVAGGETFEARFDHRISGELRLDPRDLAQPMRATVTAFASAVDTGIEMRSEHAREKLKIESFPHIGFRLVELLAAEPVEGGVRFLARGNVTLVGKNHEVEATGTVTTLDRAAQTRLDVAGETNTALLVQASFAISLEDTAFGSDGTFSEDMVPIRISLVLTLPRTSNTNKE